MVGDGAFSHKIDYIAIFYEIIKIVGHLNHITGSRGTAIWVIGWILPIGGASASEGLLSTGPTRSSLIKVTKVFVEQPGLHRSCKPGRAKGLVNLGEPAFLLNRDGDAPYFRNDPRAYPKPAGILSIVYDKAAV